MKKRLNYLLLAANALAYVGLLLANTPLFLQFTGSKTLLVLGFMVFGCFPNVWLCCQKAIASWLTTLLIIIVAIMSAYLYVDRLYYNADAQSAILFFIMPCFTWLVFYIYAIIYSLITKNTKPPR